MKRYSLQYDLSLTVISVTGKVEFHVAKITEVLRTSVSIHCYNCFSQYFLFQSHNCHSDSSLCLIQSPWNQRRALPRLLWVLHGHLLKSLCMPQCSWWSRTSCSQIAVANWARNWWNLSVNHQKMAPAVRHSKCWVMLEEWQGPLVEVLTLGRLGISRSTTWSSTGCHRSYTPLPSRLSKVAKSPPDHKVGTLKARCDPASLRAAGWQSRFSFLVFWSLGQDEGSALPLPVCT